MDPEFKRVVDILHEKLDQLRFSDPIPSHPPKQVPMLAGVYLFTEGSNFMYVGRTNNLRGRMQQHTTGTWKMAALAVKLALEEIKLVRNLYSGDQTWFREEPFLTAFRNAKIRVRNMGLRFVEEKDPMAQLLLEVYAATVLKSRYNHFDNS